ncbi:extracellular solute-binding protein [Endozoicomonas sp. OPT23]|uniref:extracellular solute-binding protein n=1 Tax=Endozoicomonas sp. OPT23 TaxID=2072845 RepID=UPI001891AB04|nr:extracellular solute-binding protein [Endozoicomonas sp. OPT23]
MITTRFLRLLTSLLFFTASTALFADRLPTELRQASLSLHGESKYPANFKHFDYVNPDAPKGGTLQQASVGTFDSLNAYIEKGTSAAGLDLLYDTLMVNSADEPFSMYPLIAQLAEPAEDNSEITFHLNPKARFHDGSPITAQDVVFTFNILRNKASPFYRTYYKDIKTVEALSKLSVRFIFTRNDNPELPLIISQLPVFPEHFWQKPENDFEAGNMTFPLANGPYRVLSAESGREVVYERVKDYWAKDLPVNKGRHNFDLLKYDYYRDANVALQALKAGEYDLHLEYIAKNWATAYDIPAVDEGLLVKEVIPSKSPEGMQGFVYNLRKDKFKDSNVRRALSYAMDFEWLNRNLFYSSYLRTKSYFENSDMKATGIPSGKELELLEPWRDQLPAELFTDEYTLPKTDGSGRIRNQLSQALELMKKAGWSLESGKLQKNGEPFEFEILLFNSGMEKVVLPFKKNLETMGVTVTMRMVDISQYINRMRSFDYDMVVTRYGQSSTPGNEQREYWGSSSADQSGSRNYIGLKSPAVDAMIDQLVQAKTREDLIVAARALDRVLLWGNYMIPQWYYPYHRVAYWKPVNYPRLKPGQEPLYRFDLQTWWRDPVEENQFVQEQRKDKEKGNVILSSLVAIFFLVFVVGWYIRRKKQVEKLL